MWVQLNDELVDETDARVSIFDRGFMYGDGVFETMRAYAGIVFGLSEHLNRLTRSAALLRIPVSRSLVAMGSDIEQVLTRNRLRDAVVRIGVSRGRGARGMAMPANGTGTYSVTAEPIPDDLSERQKRGVWLKVVEIRKTPDACVPSDAKHANYLNSILAYLEAVEVGADDGLMRTVGGSIAECATSNLFFVSHGRLCTPSIELGILPGTIRAAVLGLARSRGLESLESRFDVEDVLTAEEAFVTNSVVEILPVRRIESRRYPVPGFETERLWALLSEKIRAETRS